MKRMYVAAAAVALLWLQTQTSSATPQPASPAPEFSTEPLPSSQANENAPSIDLPDNAVAADADSSRLISLDDGYAIVEVTRQFRGRSIQDDCSHLVHAVYQRAGLDYAYWPSVELYSGVPPFARVAHPQPGDLIVWPGHVGIVMDPRERTFFSTLRYGPMIDFYDTPDWLRRGNARFYRYIRSNAAGPHLLRTTAPVAESDAAPPLPDLPLQASFQSASENPKTVDVHPAVQRLTQQAAQFVASGANAGRVIWIADDVRVRKLRTNGGQGSIDVQIDSSIELTHQRIINKHHSFRRRWPIQQVNGEWLLIMPSEDLIAARASAISIAAQNLSRLTNSPTPAMRTEARQHSEEAHLARLLNLMLDR